MTVLIVAILHGRTKEEWYSWIAHRVENGIGYETPSTPPQLYAPSRILSFRARQEALEAHEKARQEEENSAPSNTPFAGIARILGSSGGISFSPGSRIFTDNGPLMFSGDDNDDESGEEMPGSFINDESDDSTGTLSDHIEKVTQDRDGDTHMSDSHLNETNELQGEAPPSPRPLPNGDTKTIVVPIEQLRPEPGGDAHASVAKIEGFLDLSEDPLKA